MIYVFIFSFQPKTPKHQFNVQNFHRFLASCEKLIEMSDFLQFKPGKFGTYMSFFVMISGIIISIVTGHYAAGYIDISSWDEGCPGTYLDECKQNSAVFRVSFALTLFFIMQIIGTTILTKSFDYLWVIKIVVFGAILFGFFYAKSTVFDIHGYAWFARITGFLFLILQQIILLDVAYTWNEKWIEKAGDDENSLWLTGLLVTSCVLYAGSFSAIGVMYWQFTCEAATIIISLTICLPVLATVVQVFFSEQGSILTSAIMTSYATYVCFSAITLNPNSSCNPTISSSYQTLSTVLILIIIFLLFCYRLVFIYCIYIRTWL
jgi:hypothetical protein